MLREAGVEVVTGVMEAEARRLNKAFMTLQLKGRPYIILKWARSADGFIDRSRTDASVPPVVLSTAATSREVHRLRSEVAAIMVGTRTALLDNPSLNVRHWYGRSPVRVVLDRRLEIPASYHLLDGSTPTLVFTEREAPECDGVEYIRIDFGSSVPGQVLRELAARKIDSLLVEGGARLLRSFLDEGLWDEARVETSPVLLGEGVEAPVLDRRAVSLLEGPSIRCFRHPEWTL